MADDNKKSEHINLKVLGQDNAIIQFKIKRHTQLRKLMIAFCERAHLAREAVRFRFDGCPVNELDTPDSLEMEEGDTIEVYQPQTGGVLPLRAWSEHGLCSNTIIFHSGKLTKYKFI